jgi:hypothetical protein
MTPLIGKSTLTTITPDDYKIQSLLREFPDQSKAGIVFVVPVYQPLLKPKKDKRESRSSDFLQTPTPLPKRQKSPIGRPIQRGAQLEQVEQVEDPSIKEESSWLESDDWDEEEARVIVKEELTKEPTSDDEYFPIEGELCGGSALGQAEASVEGNRGVEEARQTPIRTRQAFKGTGQALEAKKALKPKKYRKKLN